MTRRSNRQEDSLEMLLDTMCNAFGGLILIAILIAILARTTDGRPGPGESPEYVRASGDNKRLKGEAGTLQGQYTNINTKVGAIDPGITNLWINLTNLVELATAKSNLVMGVEATVGETGAIEGEINNINQMIDDVSGQINIAEAERIGLETEAEVATGKKAEKIRPPNAEVVQLQSVAVVVKDGKFWAIHTFDSTGIKKLNSVVCNIQRDGSGNAQKLKLKPEVGVAVPGNLAQLNTSSIGGYFRLFPKRKYLCKLFIHKNSFKEGRLLMNMLIKKGIRYNWTPDPRNEIEFVVGRSGPERAQ
jgi:hypothetical protein